MSRSDLGGTGSIRVDHRRPNPISASRVEVAVSLRSAMSDKSPRQALSKKSAKSIKEKRAIKKQKKADDLTRGSSSDRGTA
ncbi:hypothetical protein GCM10023321_33930 [Pseudonocardia eucalypti]|uniref:Uncharacterized protein n=1 Tax=Pseudonocardia eucalypti TaxID=648755 RepID=A0ABP9QAI1_9PSEU